MMIAFYLNYTAAIVIVGNIVDNALEYNTFWYFNIRTFYLFPFSLFVELYFSHIVEMHIVSYFQHIFIHFGTSYLNMDVDFSKAPISGSYAEPWAGNLLIPSLSAQDLIYVVHYGSINLGEVDLSKYSKVTVTYATPVGSDSAGGDFATQYEATAKRVMLLNTASDIQDGSAFEYLPAESAIIASAQYSMSATNLALTTVEIDLSAIDYNGQTYLTFDFRDANNAFGATSYLIVVTDIVFQ